jgi:D-alanyl-D-alanine carboxypeptidase/D-alanyl-D-alanine-endopeptidase (penicillin-binding protein 4)
MVSSTLRGLAGLLVCATASIGCTASNPAMVAHTQVDASTPRTQRQSAEAKDSGSPTLDARIQEIMRRPEFHNARWGMQFYSPDTKQAIYSINSDQLFQPASAVKVFIAGTAFSALGPDYRFRTSVYRTGPVDDGVLKGDLVLVAAGDLLLGGRVQRDGTLALPEPDHTYDMHPDAVPVPGDPLRSIREIADQVVERGIKRIEGRVLVDASLFREAKGEAGGTGKFTVSPMMINDNLVDVIVTPGSREGEPGALRISPETAYLKVINQTKTTAASAAPAGRMPLMGPGALRFVNDVSDSDGTQTVTLTGNISLGGRPALRVYRVPEPVRFAETVLAEALHEKGISAKVDLLANPDIQALSGFYTPQNRVAEHVSLPLSEQVKVMLKVSSNPHTVQFPYLVGAIAGRDRENAKKTGHEFQRKLFENAGLDQAGGNSAGDLGGKYSPDSFIRFLTYMSQQPYFPKYLAALPIMGRDGSLAQVQVKSPAAGHVYAKTGTGMSMRPAAGNSGPAKNAMQVVKALAGFIELPDRRFMVFAVFLEFEDQRGFKGVEQLNQVMGEIASVVYESLVFRSQ